MEPRSPCHARMFYIFQMSDRPALRPSVAVGEALRGVAHDILDQARAALEDPARPEAGAPHAALDALDDLVKHGLALSARSDAGVRGHNEPIRRSAETTLDADMRRG